MLGWDVLDATDWSRLFHAYGPASDLPVALRMLQGDDRDAWRDAISRLDTGVLHQGSLCPATPPALQLVAGIIFDPKFRELDPDPMTLFAAFDDELSFVAQFLNFLADAGESAHSRPEPDTTIEPDELTAFYSALSADNDDAWDMPGAEMAEAQALIDTRALAGELLPVLVEATTRFDGTDRVAALDAVAAWMGLQPAAQEEAALALMRRELADGDRTRRARAVLALGRAGVDVSSCFDDADPAIRAMTALALPDDPRSVDCAIAALTDSRAAHTWFVRAPRALDLSPRQLLTNLLVDRRPSLKRALLAVLDLIHNGGRFASGGWGEALRLAFQEVEFVPGHRPPPPTSLSHAQRQVLSALVENDNLWDPKDGNSHGARFRVGLPDTPADVRRLAESLPTRPTSGA